ncbi:PAS domain-containing sensor histidine kinase [Sphingopyxis sp. JAI128]|uniref:sensor histidine kinase n=1 Tax=Sphingopyxis sp. JAI128 TaxID=2723066 RepID=UPI00161ACE80|nr:sensor histidine kinase [Sphingopyxis sp. JAI128]MBB6427865.1 nitrogen fixation/metabolism regulation signal transduction histidine kinase [Sphingopyxis sp. JAI128]
MGSSGERGGKRHWSFAAGLAARGLVAGCFAAGSAALLLSGRPALALIAGGVAITALFALVRAARQAERTMRELADQLAIAIDDRPSALPSAFADLDAAIVRAVDAMRQREARHRTQAHSDDALLDTVPAALFLTDAAGGLLRTNRAARALAPAAPARFADHPAFVAADAATLLAGPPEAGRLLRLTDGRSAHASVGLFDIADGSRRRLIAVQTVAEQLGAVETDAWHRLSRVLAHEMMNSLSPVISLAESLAALDPAAAPDRGEAAAAAATIARRAQHLMGFVERYRQCLAIPQPRPEPVDLATFGADMVALARGFDPRAALQIDAAAPDAVVAIDRELVEQALLNLLKNAVEAAADRPQPVVTFGWDIAGDMLCFTVEDNGPGLPPDAEDIFLPFYTTKADGGGIGLTIARQIAISHGGALTAEPLPAGTKLLMQLRM